jgi:hypothetical protein
MFKKNIELWIAFLFMLVVAVIYIQIVSATEVPAASGILGHSLGIIGFVLMLMTEILYSLRKRYQFARWGKLQHWLSFHIFTGITGPFLVLLHTSWKFNGLAGVLTLLTLIIVGSGFIGRYFYTALPRSAEGAVLEADQVTRQISQTEQDLEKWQSSHPELLQKIESRSRPDTSKSPSPLLALDPKSPGSFQGELDSQEIEKTLRSLVNRRRQLTSQLKNLDRSRRLLAIWHTFHVPLGAALFMIAFIHVAATLYYATLLH